MCRAVPCRAVLCCTIYYAVSAVLCCTVPCWAVLCRAVPCCAVLCRAALCCTVLRCTVLFGACRAVLCCTTLRCLCCQCCALLYSGVLCFAVLFWAVPCCAQPCCAVFYSAAPPPLWTAPCPYIPTTVALFYRAHLQFANRLFFLLLASGWFCPRGGQGDLLPGGGLWALAAYSSTCGTKSGLSTLLIKTKKAWRWQKLTDWKCW